jgi:HSP20 family molecular chaperone IbpA
MKIYYMTTNNTSVLTGSLTVGSSDLITTTSSNPYYGGYSSNGIVFSTSNSYYSISRFPAVIKQEETEEGLKYLFAVPGCGKENISVTYLEQDSFFKVEADVEFIDKSSPCKIHVNTDKFDLSKIECSVKNGLLKVLVPYFEDAVPKSVKVS